MRKTLMLICLVFFSLKTMYPQEQPLGGNNPAFPGTGGQSFFNDALSRVDNAFNRTGFSPEDAYYLGRAVAANILAVYKPYTEDPDLTRYLNRICQTIVINSSQVEIFNGYHVMILDSPQFNAFASPGGHIFITRGLVEITTSEDTLAAIIAHELAHIILKHGLSLINDMSLSNEMAAMADQAAQLAGKNSPGVKRLMDYRNSVSTIMDTMIKNGYSQAYEFEADREAVTLLAASGYDPGALMEMLKILQRVQSTQKGGFNTTHPSPADRIANLEMSSRLYHTQDTRSYRAPRFRKK